MRSPAGGKGGSGSEVHVAREGSAETVRRQLPVSLRANADPPEKPTLVKFGRTGNAQFGTSTCCQEAAAFDETQRPPK
jgi:hypothetical protein